MFAPNDNARVLFEPFVTLDPAWTGIAGWQLGVDHSSITPLVGNATMISRQVDGRVMAVSLSFEVPSTATLVLSLGPGVVPCEMRCIAGSCVLHSVQSGVPSDTTPVAVTRGTLRLFAFPGGFMLPSTHCSILLPDGSISSVVTEDSGNGSEIDVSATAGIRIMGIDAIR